MSSTDNELKRFWPGAVDDFDGLRAVMDENPDGDYVSYADVEPKLKELEQLKTYLSTPETDDFFAGIEAEAAHQRYRWPSDNDAGKTPADWFWLVGYLAGKCLAAHIAGDVHKALHHTISTAAALANWHRAIKGVGTMRPGIATPVDDQPKTK